MPRDVDKRKTRKALKKLRDTVARAEAEGIELSDWELTFIEEVEARLEEYGSAFADPSKGDLDEALSMAQGRIMKELDKKSRGKAPARFGQRSSFKPKASKSRYSKSEDIEHEEPEEEPVVPQLKPKPKLRPVRAKPVEPPTSSDEHAPPKARPVFKVIDGGKSD